MSYLIWVASNTSPFYWLHSSLFQCFMFKTRQTFCKTPSWSPCSGAMPYSLTLFCGSQTVSAPRTWYCCFKNRSFPVDRICSLVDSHMSTDHVSGDKGAVTDSLLVFSHEIQSLPIPNKCAFAHDNKIIHVKRLQLNRACFSTLCHQYPEDITLQNEEQSPQVAAWRCTAFQFFTSQYISIILNNTPPVHFLAKQHSERIPRWHC